MFSAIAFFLVYGGNMLDPGCCYRLWIYFEFWIWIYMVIYIRTVVHSKWSNLNWWNYLFVSWINTLVISIKLSFRVIKVCDIHSSQNWFWKNWNFKYSICYSCRLQMTNRTQLKTFPAKASQLASPTSSVLNINRTEDIMVDKFLMPIVCVLIMKY